MTRKRPIKAVKASSKGKPKPAPVKPLVGPVSGLKRPSWDDPEWEPKTDAFLWNEFEKRLATQKKTPNQNEELKKRYREKLSGWIERMVAMRSEKTGRWAANPPAFQDEIHKAYDAGLADRAALDDSSRAVEQFKASRTGLDAARVELMEEEAGVDIAAHVAAEHAATPKQEWAIAKALEELGWWLVEAIPSKGGKKARWKEILPLSRPDKPGFFNAQHRYTLTPGGKRQREKSPIRQTISATASKKLLNHLRAKLDNAQASGDDRVSSAARIMKKWEKGQAAVVHFLTLFHQRCSGTRREVLERRQRLAEADAHRLERPRKVGDTKEKASKTMENDFAWIRARRRTP